MPDALLHQDQLIWPVIFSSGTLVRYLPCRSLGSAYVGGPLAQKFVGQTFGTEPLHRVFTFSPGELPQPKGHYLQGSMGLYFGFRYDGCELRYRIPVLQGVNAQYIQETSPVEVLEMAPHESSPDWPYEDYPRLLPYVQLRESSRESIEPEEFASQYPWQGIEDISFNDLIVIVPAIPNLGVSLWGHAGDQEAVQIVYRYNYETQLVSVTTQCA